MESKTALGVLCGAGAALCWSVGFVAARHGVLVGLSPLVIALHRYVWPGLALIPMIVANGVGDLAGLLDPGYLAQRRSLIGEAASLELRPGRLNGLDPRLPDLSAVSSPRDSASSGEPTVQRDGRTKGDTCHLVARDPLSGAILWVSPQLGPLHWQSPIVVDGALYLIDDNGRPWKFTAEVSDPIFADGFDG